MTVTKLERQKRRKSRWSVFVDGEFAFGLDETDLLYYKLKEGDEISPQRFEYIRDQVVLVKAGQKALDFLSLRPRTVMEVEKKLSEDYAPDITSRVMDMLFEYKYLDDGSYAVEYVKERIKAGYGPLKIEWELRGRGVCQDLIDAALEQITESYMHSSATVALNAKYKKKPEMDEKEKSRAFSYLLRRGFGSEMAISAVTSYKLQVTSEVFESDVSTLRHTEQ